MKSWSRFINEGYYEVPPEYMEKITEFINKILKENNLTRDEYLEIENYADNSIFDESGGGLNFRINTAFKNPFLISSNFTEKDLSHAKKFIKSEMTRNIKWSKKKDEFNEQIKEFNIIIGELTDLYNLYPDDRKNIHSYVYGEIISIFITPKNINDLLELSKIYQSIGYAISKQDFFRILNHGRKSNHESDDDYKKLKFMLGSVRDYPYKENK